MLRFRIYFYVDPGSKICPCGSGFKGVKTKEEKLHQKFSTKEEKLHKKISTIFQNDINKSLKINNKI